jgi:putative phosphoesterase
VKLGVVSDVHNNVEALSYAVEHLSDCSSILSLGDLVSEYSVSPEIIRLARSAGLIGIRGNHEKTILMHPGSSLRERIDADDLAYITALPASRELHIDGRTVQVAHGALWDDPHDWRCQYIFPRDAAMLARLNSVAAAADLILLGHTHVPMAVKLDSCLVLNPGSCGEARDGTGRLSYAEIDFSDGIATIFAVRPGAAPEAFSRSEF